jgi:FKBP-type peptidyl-prolyl cis-trans isomerase FkpA
MTKRILMKTTMVTLALVLAGGFLFAAGAKETAPNAVTGRIIEIPETGDAPVFTVRLTDGSSVTLVADGNTESAVPVSELQMGDYIEFVADETSYAKNIRWITPIVSLGYKDVSISKSVVMKPTSLENRFSYTYGYLLLKSFASQGLYFDIDYFVRGTLDAIQVYAQKPITEFFSGDDMNALVQQYQDEVWSKGTAPTAFSGTMYTDLESIGEMAKPEELFQSFSYVYGYLVTYNMMGQGLSINGPYFAYGMLALGTDDVPVLSDEEMQAAFSEMQAEMQKQYEAMVAELKVKNLATAEAFLADNGKKDGVVTTASGLQYQVITTGTGAQPAATDNVTFNYVLKDIEGKVLQDSKASGDTAPTMALANLVPGLQEGIPLMKVGSSYRFWLHPTLAYGENGAGEDIQPNQMIIFDVELIDIPKTDPAATPAN